MAQNQVISEKISLAKLLLNGYIFRDILVRKASPTSACIYLPKRLEGKRFRVILLPEEDSDDFIL